MKRAALLFCLIVFPLAAGAPVSLAALAGQSAGDSDSKVDGWLSEADGLKNAEVVGKGMVSGPVSRMGADVIIKGRVAGPVSVMSGRLFVLGRVDGPVAVVAGDATILGTVSGPVSVFDGNLRVAGQIGGPVSVVGGTLDRSSDAVINGNTSVVGGDFHFLDGLIRGKNGPWPLLGRLRAAWGRHFWWHLALMIWWIGASALAALVMPGPIANSAQRLAENPLKAGAIGLLYAIVLIFAVLIGVLLCFLLIGIPILGLLFLAALAVKWFGLTVVFLWVGGALCRPLGLGPSSRLLPVFIGALALSLLRLIPIAGFVIWLIACLLGDGIAMMALFQRSRQPPPPQLATPVAG